MSTNHPNRGLNREINLWANPTPEMVRAARTQLGLTEKEAAALVFRREQAWRDWESGQRRMGPGDWVLFRIRTRLLPISAILSNGHRDATDEN